MFPCRVHRSAAGGPAYGRMTKKTTGRQKDNRMTKKTTGRQKDSRTTAYGMTKDKLEVATPSGDFLLEAGGLVEDVLFVGAF